MRIAQVAPLYECVPPKLYGGTERVVAYLTDELVRQGHDVTLFSSGDSTTLAHHVPVGETAVRLDSSCIDPLARHILLLEKVFARAKEFDVLHFHIDYLHFPMSRRHAVPNLTTLHGRLDIPDLVPIYDEYPEMPVVSISDAQRVPLPHLNWLGTVHHGLPGGLYRLGSGSGGYLAFLGRLSPEKRPDRAIRIAERAGVKLLIAAKVDRADRTYFEECIRPMLRSPWVEFIGEIGEGEKNEFLGNAKALLFPIDWPEPFGLVMVEAMGSGTATIAFDCGSVREIIDEGVTGFIVNSEEEAVEAVGRVDSLDRMLCRRQFERRFTVEQMAGAYALQYARLLHHIPTKPRLTNKDERAA
ncbi:MAG: glycosyltransferase family 4 protein [Gammaproteobacteria bacterium]|nr:glycosyltransferase family 4 protein [Gammaproteobacteria bacterium]